MVYQEVFAYAQKMLKILVKTLKKRSKGHSVTLIPLATSVGLHYTVNRAGLTSRNEAVKSKESKGNGFHRQITPEK